MGGIVDKRPSLSSYGAQNREAESCNESGEREAGSDDITLHRSEIVDFHLKSVDAFAEVVDVVLVAGRSSSMACWLAAPS